MWTQLLLILLTTVALGDSVTFGTGVLMYLFGVCNLKLFGVGGIIWGLKFRGPKCAICGLKFGAGEIF